jgi:hypothetical protein
MRREEQKHEDRSGEHEERSAGTCRKKRRTMRREAQEHEDRSAGTCRKKRRTMRTEAQEHVEKSTRPPCYEFTCKFKAGLATGDRRFYFTSPKDT